MWMESSGRTSTPDSARMKTSITCQGIQTLTLDFTKPQRMLKISKFTGTCRFVQPRLKICTRLETTTLLKLQTFRRFSSFAIQLHLMLPVQTRKSWISGQRINLSSSSLIRKSSSSTNLDRSGSESQPKLSFTPSTSKPEQITFRCSPGQAWSCTIITCQLLHRRVRITLASPQRTCRRELFRTAILSKALSPSRSH